MSDWLCKKPECRDHGVCLEMEGVEGVDPMTSIEYKAPRVLKFSEKFRRPILYCICHNCEQWRRWQAYRNRATRWQDG